MIEILLEIWSFLCDLKSLLVTVWFAIHGVLRFIFRMPAAILIFIDALPVWVVPVAIICMLVGFGLLLSGRS